MPNARGGWMRRRAPTPLSQALTIVSYRPKTANDPSSALLARIVGTFAGVE